MKTIKIGDTFPKYGHNWKALEVFPDENKDFKWLKVVAVWSGTDVEPLWSNESRIFYMYRTRKSTGRLV